jgi:hypothetical protein
MSEKPKETDLSLVWSKIDEKELSNYLLIQTTVLIRYLKEF